MAVYPTYKDTEYISINDMTVDNTLKFIPEGSMGQDALNVLLLDKQMSALWLNQMKLIDAQAKDDEIRPALLSIGKWGSRIFSKLGAGIIFAVTLTAAFFGNKYLDTHMNDKDTQIQELRQLLMDEGIMNDDIEETK